MILSEENGYFEKGMIIFSVRVADSEFVFKGQVLGYAFRWHNLWSVLEQSSLVVR